MPLIWVAILVLSAAALAPALAGLRRATPAAPPSPETAFHRAQLAELERERDDGLISPAEYAAARLEVQRRLLAAAASDTGPTMGSRRWPLLVAAVIVPLAALSLYLRVGSPGVPAAPLAARLAHDRSVIAELTQRLSGIANDPAALWRAQVIIGSAESDMGDWAKAAAAWNAALAIHFDPMLAAQAAEAETRAQGGVTQKAAALFRAALAAAPADAPWRAAAEARLREAPR